MELDPKNTQDISPSFSLHVSFYLEQNKHK